MDPSALGAVAYLSAVAGVGGFLLYFTLLDDLGPIEMSFIEYVIPVFAALAGWLVLGQDVTLTTVVGFASFWRGSSPRSGGLSAGRSGPWFPNVCKPSRTRSFGDPVTAGEWVEPHAPDFALSVSRWRRTHPPGVIDVSAAGTHPSVTGRFGRTISHPRR